MAALAQGLQPNGNLPRGWPCADARPVDRTYVDTAEATGGQVFLFHPAEVGRSSALIIGTMKHEETLFRAMGSLDRTHRDFPVWVDSTVESVMFSVSLQCKERIIIYDPQSREYRGGEIQEFQAGRIVTIPKPEPGAWQVRVMGRGMFFVVAMAKSQLHFMKIEPVYYGGRPAHEGWFPTKKPLQLGAEHMLSAEVVGPAYSVNFRLVASDGSSIQELLLNPVDSGEENDWRHFLGPFKPVHPAFRFVAEGRDKQGQVFQRFFPALFRPQSPVR
jgi:hypothetical protein